MSHGVHNHGHHAHGPHGHGNHGAAAARASGPKQSPFASSTPAAQAQQTQQTQQAQPPVDLSALEKNIQNLQANFHADTFNNQPAAEGIQAAPSTVPNAAANWTKDVFQPQAGAVDTAPTTSALNDPILNQKGGGGMSGGVLRSGDLSYLGQSGGGGMSGGVLKS